MKMIGKGLGIILVIAIILVIIAPWVVTDALHIQKVFSGQLGKIYIREDKTGYHAITFEENNHMCLYHYKDVNPFAVPSIAGLKMDFSYKGSESIGIGRIHFSPSISLLPWNNYVLYEKGERERATIQLILNKAMSIDVELFSEVDKKNIYTTEISVFDDYIVFDGEKYTLISDENDATDYVLLWFDKYGTELE